MKVLTEGHRYLLPNFEQPDKPGQIIQFIHKIPAENPEFIGQLKTVNDGTTNEELIKVLINRLYYLQSKFPCRENTKAIRNLEKSLMWLNKRTQDRIDRNVEGKQIA